MELPESGKAQGWVLRHSITTLKKECAGDAFRYFLSRGDAAWYSTVADNGYTEEAFSSKQQKNWAFFPLYPLVLKVAAKIFPNSNLAGISISSFLFLAGLICLARYAGTLGFSSDAISRTLWLVSFFPVSYFFSGSMTESLFFFLSVATFLALQSRFHFLGALFYSLLIVSRPTGILLAPAFLLAYLQGVRGWRPMTALKRAAFLFLPALTLSGFAHHLYVKTGNPIAFFSIQSAWRSETDTLLKFASQLKNPTLDWSFVWLNAASGFLSLYVAYKLFRENKFMLALICIVPTLIAAYSGGVLSLSRITLVQFPIFLYLGEKMLSRTIERGWFGISGALLAFNTVGVVFHLTSVLT